ncbi:hypothetical protein QMM95_13910 [Leptospira santarosai]|uniref:hypothetical protein n=1 Tax=Leptospira santarosai TaxID=28183 RepID=UPI0024AFCABA|nr:hypothetical protein [Leptospira santarosai]MDI7237164.1 hypothetical protein [Leptospira santarosai]
MIDNVIFQINDLPSIEEIRKKAQALALLDAILIPDWEFRYFSFNNNWDGNKTEALASMRDGSGEEYFILFSRNGVIGKVLTKNKVQNSVQLLEAVPESFSSFKNEPAFSLSNITFLFWRKIEDKNWNSIPNNLNAYPLLKFLTESSSFYHSWVEDYCEKKIDFNSIDKVFNSHKITPELLLVLNHNLSIEDLHDDLNEILD